MNIKKFFFVIFLIIPSISQASEIIDDWFRDYKMDVSFSFHELGFTVASADPENLPLGKLAGGMLPTFLVNFETRERYFGRSQFGYNIIAGLSTYCVNTQKLEDDTVVNLNTSASGMMAYITPTLFYTLGDKYYKDNNYRAFKLGIGLGAGYLSATGNITLTETDNSTIPLDINGFGASSSLFIEYYRDRWIYRLRAMGPSFTDSTYRYSVYDVYLGIGYQIKI